MNIVKCPHCGKDVEISEAIAHELSEKVRIEEKKKLETQFQEQREKETEEQEKILRKKFEEETKEKDLALKEKDEETKKLQERLEKELEEREKSEEKIREQITKDSRLEKLELEKKLRDTQNALEDAQRKAKQTSQQLQGEVLELELEQKLRETFSHDEFTPIPKGVEGGDIWQKVVFNGKVVGSILWETKRTKAWSSSWSKKLKSDAGRISASEAIIVSGVLPNGTSNFDRQDGVWVTTYEHAISICRYVRFLITTVATIKSGASQTDEEWGKVRDYMLSDAFKHRMQSHFDSVKELKDTLEAEKRATILRWKKQESQIEKLDNNTTNFYGELKARISDLPEIGINDSSLLEDGTDEEQKPSLF